MLSNEPYKEEWKKEFVKKFFVYDLQKNSPAGAEKDAIKFIEDLLDQETTRAVKQKDTFVDMQISALLKEFANTSLDSRGNGRDWLLKLRESLQIEDKK